jgi:hypothetical protein
MHKTSSFTRLFCMMIPPIIYWWLEEIVNMNFGASGSSINLHPSLL